MAVFWVIIGMAAIFALLGVAFFRTKDPQRAVLYLTGDYTGLDAAKVCHTAGRRMLWWAAVLVLCAAVALWNRKWGLCLAVGVPLVCVAYHALDMVQNRDRYRK